MFRERLLFCMCASFPFSFEDGICDLVVLVPDYCLSIYFAAAANTGNVIKRIIKAKTVALTRCQTPKSVNRNI